MGNKVQVAMEAAAAAEARRKEEERKARIDKGLKGIKEAFEGRPEMKKVQKTFDWKKFAAPASTAAANTQVPGMPAGYTYIQMDAPPPPAPKPGGKGKGGKTTTPAPAPKPTGPTYVAGSGGANEGTYNIGGAIPTGSTAYGGANEGQVGPPMNPSSPTGMPGGAPAPGTPGATGSNKVWGIRGPDGKLYASGSDVLWSTDQATGKTVGGIQDSFYDDFNKAMLDFYNPQVMDQYGKAKDEATYRLARAGTLRSSGAADVTGDLLQQSLLNQADVVSKADTATADLVDRTAKERANAEAQLYATENPEVAINQAITAASNLKDTLKTPETTPLGEVFKVAAIGGANALQGYRNQSMINSLPPQYRTPGSRIV